MVEYDLPQICLNTSPDLIQVGLEFFILDGQVKQFLLSDYKAHLIWICAPHELALPVCGHDAF